MNDMDKYINNLVSEFKRLSFDDVENCSDTEKLLYLYAYYHYFNADSSKISDIILGNIFQHGALDHITGIYIDQDSEMGDVDAVIAVYSENNAFDFPAILKMFKDAEASICAAQERKANVRKELSALLNDDDYKVSATRPLKIRLITNHNPKTVGNKRSITNALQAMKPERDFVTYHLSFGLDIEYEIVEIENPKEYVDEAVIQLDAPNNFMRFGMEESLIVNISAMSLKNLYEQYGYRGLFAQNLRYYVKNAKIDGNIIESIQEHPENFWYYNNGVILICDDYIIEGDRILVQNFSIINGGQTTKIVGETDFERDFFISDDASGILVEGVLESMAEYYSVELSQKIHRGMQINAQKCLSNGSNPGLGYKVDSERRFYVDEDEAKIVREIFHRYASGETVADIIRDLNSRKITTSLGREFNKNSLHRLLRNRRYIGMYIYKGEETPGGMPQIVDDGLFERVQNILDRNKAAPARSRGKQEYLLTTKLFCGHCKEMMTGYTGAGKHGNKYHYYICNGAKKKVCDKKVIQKALVEERVVQACSELLTEEKVKYIADQVYAACKKDGDLLSARKLKTALKEADSAIENLWVALEKGQAVDMITERFHKREAEKKELEKQLAIEIKKQSGMEYSVILSFLDYLRMLPNDNDYKRRALVNIFINAIYLYDGYFTMILNAGNRPLGIENIPLDDIEKTFENDDAGCSSNSQLVADAPP